MYMRVYVRLRMRELYIVMHTVLDNVILEEKKITMNQL